MIHNISPSFISKVELVSTQRKPRPLSIIDENNKDSSLADNKNTPLKIKEKSAKNIKGSRPPRRLAVAPLQHPVFDLVVDNVDVTTKNQENKNNEGNALSIQVQNICEHRSYKQPWDILDEDNKERSTPPPYLNKVFDSLSEDNVDNKNPEVHPLTYEHEINEITEIDNIEPKSSVYPIKCLVRSASYKDKRLNENEANQEPKCQTKQGLDKDLFAWREKVKECVSFPSLPDKFRPLRRSVGNYVKTSYVLDEVKGNGSDSYRRLGKEVRFYLPGQKPDYLINPNTVVTRHPGQSKIHYCDSPKLSSVVRKFSLQEQRPRRPDDDDCNDSDNISGTRTPVITISRELDSKSCHETDEVRSCLNDFDVPVSDQSGDLPANTHASDSGSDAMCHTSRGSSVDQSHYHILKETITHLKLPTRRASTMAWQAQYLDRESGNGFFLKKSTHYRDEGPLTQEKKNDINKSLEFLRQELLSIRHQDQDLAKQFLAIRTTMSKLRWKVQCQNHEQLLEEVEDDIEDLRALSRVMDTPTDLFSSTSFLKQFGLTRMNITSRRFSTC